MQNKNHDRIITTIAAIGKSDRELGQMMADRYGTNPDSERLRIGKLRGRLPNSIDHLLRLLELNGYEIVIRENI